MSTVFFNTDIPKDTILEFFYIFSRMEFSLKKSGYLINSKAEANWTEFWSDNEEYFDITNNNLLAEAYSYIMSYPPKKQIINENNTLDFQEVDGDLCLHIRRIRNNLFHGGKFSISDVDTTRNKKLIDSSILILEAFKDLDSCVKSNFDEDSYTSQN